MSSSSFASTFESLKQRLLAVGGAMGVACGTCATVAVVGAAVWLDLVWELSSAARVAAVCVSIGAGLVLATRILTAMRTTDALLARRLDETGQTGGQIVSGLDLDLSRATGGATTLTLGLAELAVDRAASLAAQIPQTLAVPFKPARQALTAAGVMLLAAGLLFVFVPEVIAAEWRRFVDPYGDHPPFSYTSFQIEPGDTRVLYGDRMDVAVTTSGPPLEELELILIGDEPGSREEKLPMFPESQDHWKATVSSITRSGHYFVRAKKARSERHHYEVITVPQLEKVRFRITPPEYTRDAVYEGVLPQNGISGLKGTTVEVTATSNRPLSGGTIDLILNGDRQTIRLEPVVSDGTSHQVSGRWTISQAGVFHLRVTDVAGQHSRGELTGPINLLQDQSPFVRLMEPAPQSLATPSVSLPIVIGAEDDFGVSRLQLFRSLNDSRAIPIQLQVESPPSRRQEVRTSLPLLEYGLSPGDVIKLFARVEDNDPAGPKGAESPVVVVQIVADSDFERMLRAREGLDVLMSKYQEAERRLESLMNEMEQLQKQLEKRDAEGDLSDSEREQLEQLSKRIEEEANAIRESSKHVLPYDLDESLTPELQKLAEQLDQVAEQAAQTASQPNAKAGDAAKRLAEMKKQLGSKKEQFEQGVTEPMDRLSKVYPLMEDQSRFVELYHRQRDLSERLASLTQHENPDDPAIKVRMRELEAEQRKNREDLEQLLDQIESHANQVPDDDPKLKELADSAREFVEVVRGSGANQTMSDAETGLAEFSGKRSHEQASDAADILEKFISRCQGQGEAAGEACKNMKFSPGEGCLGDTLSQLLSDAGMKPGMKPGSKPGQAEGNGGGYSARRSTLNNIGLYGHFPTRGNPTQSKSGGGHKSGGIGGSFRTDPQGAQMSRLDPHGTLKGSGVSETAIPVRYRGRVEEYFRRIAEETSGKK